MADERADGAKSATAPPRTTMGGRRATSGSVIVVGRTLSPSRKPSLSKVDESAEHILVSQRPDRSARRTLSRDHLLEAAAADDGEGAEDLLAAKADPNVLDANGQTPLHWSSRHRNVKLTRQLLDSKAALDTPDRRGQTALHISADDPAVTGSSVIAGMLLSRRADPNARDDMNQTPLVIATVHHNLPVTRLLLGLGRRDISGGFSVRTNVPVAPPAKSVRVMNRAKTVLRVSFSSRDGKQQTLSLGPGNAERIPIHATRLTIRARRKDKPAPTSDLSKTEPSPQSSQKQPFVTFSTVRNESRVVIVNIHSSVVSGMQCLLYVTAKDHPRRPFNSLLWLTHANSAVAKSLFMSTDSDARGPLRMICIGSWPENEAAEAEAHRLFLKYALHQNALRAASKRR